MTEKTYINLAECANVSLKDCGITNPTVEGSVRNLALVSMIGKPVTVDVEVHVELVPKRSAVVGKDNCFPKLVMAIPKGTVIGPWKLERSHIVEFKHWAKRDAKGVYLGESYPEALKERELVAVIEKPKAVKDAPTPITDSDRDIARKVMAKLGDNMPKFLELSKVAGMLGWDYVESHYRALVKQ